MRLTVRRAWCVAVVLLFASGPASAQGVGPVNLPVRVAAASTVAPALLERMLAEAGSIWQDAGVSVDWQAMSARRTPNGAVHSLLVIVDEERGPSRPSGLPIGWVVFDGDHRPAPELHVSRRNALELLNLARRTDSGDIMPRLEEEVLLGRAMGRALAHELGHYLLASTHHTRHGLMQGRRSAGELFAIDHAGYRIADEQRRRAVSRILDGPWMTTSGVSEANAYQVLPARPLEPYGPTRPPEAHGEGTSSGDGRNV